MLVLSVAEKPSAAKRISELLANNGANRREGFSKYNKIFDYQVNIPQYGVCQMSMTSVSGHLKEIEFTENFKKWHSCNPRQLFQAQLRKQVGKGKEGIQKTLISEGRKAKMLIIWTDGDREGENIGYEIIDSVRSVNRNIILKRAKFSEITRPSILRALNNLVQPDENQSLAVDCRQELDLRIGAAFTRFQTLALQPMYPQLAASVISYGSCQFPTLGFVVDRWKANKNFQIEPFWKIELLHNQTTFNWFRQKLFCRDTVIAIQELCLASMPAKVTKMNNKPRSRWRPVAMDTILMEKLASQKLRINAQRTMAIAETLYNKGYLSYPRTETNIFPASLELSPLVAMQRHTPEYADFVDRIVDEFQECPNPRNGNKNDQAHPPIHPTKPSDDSLNPEEKKLYNLIARHFLACVSRDAKGAGTSIEVTIGGEQFGAEGLMIQEKNYRVILKKVTLKN